MQSAVASLPVLQIVTLSVMVRTHTAYRFRMLERPHSWEYRQASCAIAVHRMAALKSTTYCQC
eukprot:10010965-Karenia_brevis.AAC.1